MCRKQTREGGRFQGDRTVARSSESVLIKCAERCSWEKGEGVLRSGIEGGLVGPSIASRVSSGRGAAKLFVCGLSFNFIEPS